MKNCSKCKTKKPVSEFQKQKSATSGYRSSCKECSYSATIEWNRSPKGIVTRLWHKHNSRSKQRGHTEPEYTREWLADYVLNHKDFDSLYLKYVESGYDKYLIPSVDRLDDNIGYTKDNIRLVSFMENMEHCYSAARKKEHDNKGWDNGALTPHRAVVQLTLSGDYVNAFISVSEAARSVVGASNSKIPMACSGKRKTHAGYRWAYLEDYVNIKG